MRITVSNTCSSLSVISRAGGWPVPTPLQQDVNQEKRNHEIQVDQTVNTERSKLARTEIGDLRNSTQEFPVGQVFGGDQRHLEAGSQILRVEVGLPFVYIHFANR